MFTDLNWLATESRRIHEIFSSYFYLLVTALLLLGVVMEYFKWPIGQIPNFSILVGRTIIAALLLHAYPEITNTIADLADAVSQQLGDLNNFKLILDRMGDKLGELSWSWVSFKESVMLLLSFLTFFILYFSIYIADSFYIFVWVMLYVFSPLLIALYVLPATASATTALFKSLLEVASWKIIWSATATLLWSSALSKINQDSSQISFLTAIGFNIILAGSLLLTPFIVHALMGAGVAQMGKDLSSLAIGSATITPGKVVDSTKGLVSHSFTGSKNLASKNNLKPNYKKSNSPKRTIKS